MDHRILNVRIVCDLFACVYTHTGGNVGLSEVYSKYPKDFAESARTLAQEKSRGRAKRST